MDIITIEGDALRDLVVSLAAMHTVPHRLRVAHNDDSVKFKIDGGEWSPWYPAPASRREPRERGWQIGSGNTQTNYFGGS